MTMSLEYLEGAVSESSAFRRISRLQPIGGQGDKIFPPTYPGERNNDPPRHVFELRRLEGREVWCVLIDSVQSQANRLEEALLAAADGKGGSTPASIPYVTVNFEGKGLEPLKRITSLDAPHRVYDAILRDSQLNGVAFMETSEGRRLASAKPANATALLEISPTALVFGAWHSQGSGGGLGAKFPRTIVSEIVGVDTPVKRFIDNRSTNELEVRSAGERNSIRIDPLGIQRHIEIFKRSDGCWSTEKVTKDYKVKKPSEIIHGNIIAKVVPLGVTCDHAEHRTTITLAGIRRLQFGGGERDLAGRILVTALGLLAIAEQDTRGYALRSRCDLVREGAAPLELVNSDGSTATVAFERTSVLELYQEAYRRAENAGFNFRNLTLLPQDKLVEIVRRSRENALDGKNE